MMNKDQISRLKKAGKVTGLIVSVIVVWVYTTKWIGTGIAKTTGGDVDVACIVVCIILPILILVVCQIICLFITWIACGEAIGIFEYFDGLADK